MRRTLRPRIRHPKHVILGLRSRTSQAMRWNRGLIDQAAN
jgi:hypothetical protein